MSAFFEFTTQSHILFFGAGGVASKLTIDYTFFLQALFFIVSFVILSKYLFPPVMDVLLKRQKMVDQAHQELKRYDQEGQDMEQSYHDKIRDARMEAQRIHKQARAEANSTERELIENARIEATQTLQQRESQAREQRETLRQTLATDAERLGREIASKVLGRSL